MRRLQKQVDIDKMRDLSTALKALQKQGMHMELNPEESNVDKWIELSLKEQTDSELRDNICELSQTIVQRTGPSQSYA